MAQAVEFDALAPNIIVKIPATENGIAAMEEATYRGVSINATVSFTVPQAVAPMIGAVTVALLGGFQGLFMMSAVFAFAGALAVARVKSVR